MLFLAETFQSFVRNSLKILCCFFILGQFRAAEKGVVTDLT